MMKTMRFFATHQQLRKSYSAILLAKVASSQTRLIRLELDIARKSHMPNAVAKCEEKLADALKHEQLALEQAREAVAIVDPELAKHGFDADLKPENTMLYETEEELVASMQPL